MRGEKLVVQSVVISYSPQKNVIIPYDNRWEPLLSDAQSRIPSQGKATRV